MPHSLPLIGCVPSVIACIACFKKTLLVAIEIGVVSALLPPKLLPASLAGGPWPPPTGLRAPSPPFLVFSHVGCSPRLSACVLAFKRAALGFADVGSDVGELLAAGLANGLLGRLYPTSSLSG
jgi:hypothetical protein